MKKKYKIAFVIQSKQHGKRVTSISTQLSKNYDVCFFIAEGYAPYMKNNITFEVMDLYPKNSHKLHSKYRLLFKNIAAKFKKLRLKFSKVFSYINELLSKFLSMLNPAFTSVIHSLLYKIMKISKNFVSCSFRCIEAALSRVNRRFGVFFAIYFLISFFFEVYNSMVLVVKLLAESFCAALDKTKPDIVIFAEANIEYYTEFMILECHKKNIATLIIPYTFCSPSEPARAYINSPLHMSKSLYKSLLHKSWFYKYDNQELIRLPLLQAYAIDKFKIRPPQPWVQESCSADTIIAESTMVEKHYLKHEIPKSQIRVIGDIAYDILHKCLSKKQQIRKRILDELYLSNYNKVAVFAIFPDYTTIYKEHCEFETYNECIRYIIQSISRLEGFAVILCLHPSLQNQKFEHFESHNVKISRIPTVELLGISDIYIASVSATIKWAIAAGVPVVNYDVYKFRYGDYLDVPGVINVETKEAFEAALQTLNNSKKLKALQAKMDGIKEDWGVIDGKFSHRLNSLINELIERRRCDQ